MPTAIITSIGIISKAFKDLFDAIFKISDYNQAQKEKRFKEVLLPAYIAFIEIHKQYILWIDTCIKALPLSENFIPESDLSPITNNKVFDYSKRLSAIKEFIKEERDANDFDRIKVRANASVILGKTSNLLEKRFFVSLFNYFLQFERSSIIDEDTLDGWASQLSDENGNNIYTDTPSYVINEMLTNVFSHDEIEQILKDARNNLNFFYPQVIASFSAIQNHLYS